jgi:hypothetical protein
VAAGAQPHLPARSVGFRKLRPSLPAIEYSMWAVLWRIDPQRRSFGGGRRAYGIDIVPQLGTGATTASELA